MATSIPETPPPRGDRLGRHPDATMGHVAYALYAASILVGITAIAGVVLCYIVRSEVRATWLEGHYRWLIRTFWLGFLLNLIAFALTLVVIGYVLLPITMLWWIYRIAIGWIRLYRGQPISDPTSFL